MTNPLFRPRAWLAALALAALLPLSHAADAVPDNKALVVVRVPADAMLLVGSHATRQTGAERQFITPPLPPGKDFTYVLKATWTEGGQSKTATRNVVVRAGQKTEVDFTTDTTAKTPEPKTVPKLTEAKTVQPKSRTFLFTYDVTLTGLPADKNARVWLPVPSSNEYQEIETADASQLPAGNRIEKEPLYGNRILFSEVKPDADGNAHLAITYHVLRREVRGPSKDVPDQDKLARYLEPDALVPITGKPLELIKDKPLPKSETDIAKMLYDIVDDHMKYSKQGKGWGRGDAVWACDSKFGNCSDFHSLFISLARSQKIPAKFEMGFPLPSKHGEGEIGGYHCWAFFKPHEQGWIPVDISEANKNPKMKDYYFGNLTEDRVAFTTGRDFDLVPKQEGPPLNFFVYPYVEVDGKPYPADQVKRKFTFKDVPQ